MKTDKILIILLLNFFNNQLISQSTQKSLNLNPLIDQFDENTHIEIGIYNNGSMETMAYQKAKSKSKKVNENPDKMFEIGSITKIFTAYLTHSLIESHPNVELNSKLKEINLPFKIHKKNETKLIHLLNHTSNLPKMPLNYIEGMILNFKNPYKIYTEKKVLKYYKRHKTKSNLGKKFKYSNFGYGMLGIIISKLKTKPFKEIFKEEITNNLGLNNTQIGIVENDYPKLFLKDDESINCLWDLNKMESEGGGYSTISDLISFSEKVINKDNIDERTKRILAAMEEETIKLNDKESIAIGWRIYTKQNNKILYHDGGSRGYKSFIGIDKERNLAVVILSQNCGLNKNNHAPKSLGMGILDQLTQTKK